MYVFDDKKPFSCNENYYLRQACGENCEVDYSTTAGVSMTKGACNYKCEIQKDICQSQKEGITQLKKEFSCYKDPNKNKSFFRMFYNCLPYPKKRQLFFIIIPILHLETLYLIIHHIIYTVIS